MSIAAVVLAAGASRRLGRPKQMIEFNGETLLLRAVRLAREANLKPVIVVVREGAPSLPDLPAEDVVTVTNVHAAEGMASSIRCAIEAARAFEVCGAVIMTCDQPAIRSEHLRALTADPSSATGSAYADRIGVPAYFPADRFDELMSLRGDTGARGLLKTANAVHGEGLEIDIDTQDDVDLAKSLLENEPQGSS